MYNTKPALIDIAVLLARCSIGILLFIAGGGKVLGWFDYGLDESLEGYAKMGFAAPLAYISIYTEFIGGFLLTIGLFTRAAAFAVMINMAVATLVVLPSGLFGFGAHIPLLYLVIDIIILLIGPGTYSVDRWLLRNEM
jgi:putative oxidoreductase